MSGHYGPEVGSAMEDEFNLLLERLGYRILRKRNPEPSIDFVASFEGHPIFDRATMAPLATSVSVLPPIFAPSGVTAFSVKKGDVGNPEVEELLEYVRDALASNNSVLNSIQGRVLVTNQSKTETQLDNMLGRQVFCWDIRRLVFYATRAKVIQDMAEHGPVREHIISTNAIKGTYLIQPSGLINPHTMSVVINVFLDDHSTSFLFSSDHITAILSEICDEILASIADDTGYDLLTSISIYVLGLASSQVVRQAFLDYAGKTSLHPKVAFAAQPTLRIYQFGAAPWTVLLRS